MSAAYKLGREHALEKLGYIVYYHPVNPEEVKGQLKSMGVGGLGGAALGYGAGALSGHPGAGAVGAMAGGAVGVMGGGLSKGVSNLMTNSAHDKHVEELNKRLRSAKGEEVESILDEYDEAKASRRKKLDRLFW